MAFPHSAMKVKLCAVYMAVALLSSSAKGQNGDAGCGTGEYRDCPVPTTTDPYTTNSSSITWTTPTTTAMQSPPLTPTGFPNTTHTVRSSTVITSVTQTVPSSLECCKKCIEHCEKCSGADTCTMCSMGYVFHSETSNATGKCRVDTILDKLTIPGVIGISIGGFMIVVFIITICYCIYQRRKPPQPVEIDYRSREASMQMDSRHRFSGFSEDEANMAYHQPVDDDVYGNVDNQGNMLMLHMPDEYQSHQGMLDVPPTPTGPAPSRPINDPPEPDFGDVYENTVVGQPVESVPNRFPEVPVKPTPQEQAEPNDFGGVYTNTEFPQSMTSPSDNQRFLPRKTPPLPRKESLIPSLPIRPQDNQAQDVGRSNLPASPVIPQLPGRPFQRGESEDMPKHAPPPPPKVTAPEVSAVPVTLPRREAPPTPTKKFSSLPGTSQFSMTQNFSDDTDRLPETSPPPVPSSARKGVGVFPLRLPGDNKPLPPVTRPPSLRKKPPPTPKKNIVRHIDDDDGVRSEVQIGVLPDKMKPVSPTDFGDMYEVTMEEPPQRDYGMSYEVVDISPRGTPDDFGLSYDYVGTDADGDGEAEDYGGSYEAVEIPAAQDYGETYEIVEQPSKRPQVDMSRRAPLPLPKKGPAPPTKRKPSRGDVYEDADKSVGSVHPWGPPPPQDSSGVPQEEDFGQEYTNTSVAGPGVHNPKPANRPHPALPKKLSNLKRQEDFYDQVLNLDANSDAKGRLETFQETEDDSIYQNNPTGPAKRYKNVAQGKPDTPAKLGGYITLQKT